MFYVSQLGSWRFLSPGALSKAEFDRKLKLLLLRDNLDENGVTI